MNRRPKLKNVITTVEAMGCPLWLSLTLTGGFDISRVYVDGAVYLTSPSRKDVKEALDVLEKNNHELRKANKTDTRRCDTED